MNNSLLKQETMMRVRFIHLVKRAVRPFAIETIIAAAALFEVGRLVFVARVFQNAPSVARFQEVALFFGRAFAHTHPIVQLMVAAALVAVVLAFKDMVKTLRMLSELRFSRA